MKKKGFTLIELLAVIVILAIIALIATPLVLKYIEKSRKESKVDSAYSFVRNLETEIANYSIKNNGKKYNGQPSDKGYYELDSFNGSEIDTTVKGDKPNSIKVCLSSLGQVEKAMFEYGKYYVSYDGKKGSISDEATYSSFSCSGNVAGGGNNGGSNVGDLIVSELEIEFVEEDGISVAMLDTCLDTSLFEYGKYYNVILTDKDGNSYDNHLIAQNSVMGVSSPDGPYSFVLSNTSENLFYIDQVGSFCGFANSSSSEGDYKYIGKYDFTIVESNKKLEPNYVFRAEISNNMIYNLEFYSNELKSNDKVVFELMMPEGKKVYTEYVGDFDYQIDRLIYSNSYFKRVNYSFYTGGGALADIADLNIIINDGEKTYSFKKEDFKRASIEGGLGCIYGDYYYVGNNDIDDGDGC